MQFDSPQTIFLQYCGRVIISVTAVAQVITRFSLFDNIFSENMVTKIVLLSVHIFEERYKIAAESVPYRASESAVWFDSGVDVGLIVATICSVSGVGIG